MKRILAITLCAMLILAAFTGCAEPTDPDTPQTEAQTPTEELPADTEAEQTETEETVWGVQTDNYTVTELPEQTTAESEEIETRLEEQETKPESQETKPEGQETKPEEQESKPENQETKPESQETSQESQESKPDEQTTNQELTDFDLDDIIGVWHIDESELASLRDKFPGIDESGTSMEIKSDGNISWYVGANSFTGTFKASGSGLTAEVTGDNDNAKMTVAVTFTDEGTAIMNFLDTEIIWTYGDGGSPRG